MIVYNYYKKYILSSQANRNKARKNNYFVHLDENRISFTMRRGIHLAKANNKNLNFAISPYVEVEGKTYSKVKVLCKHFHICDD